MQNPYLQQPTFNSMPSFNSNSSSFYPYNMQLQQQNQMINPKNWSQLQNQQVQPFNIFRNNPFQGNSEKLCYSCRQKGHIAKDCTFKPPTKVMSEEDREMRGKKETVCRTKEIAVCEPPMTVCQDSSVVLCDTESVRGKEVREIAKEGTHLDKEKDVEMETVSQREEKSEEKKAVEVEEEGEEKTRESEESLTDEAEDYWVEEREEKSREDENRSERKDAENEESLFSLLCSEMGLAVENAKQGGNRPAINRFLREYKTNIKKFELEKQEMKCKFCKKRGHTEKSCPDLTPRSEWDQYFGEIASKKSVDVDLLTVRKEPAQLIEEVCTLGEKLNSENPWKDSSKEGRVYCNRLRARIGYWKAMGAKINTMCWLYNGVKTKFIQEPEKADFRNHPSYYEHIQFVHEEIKKHLQDGSFVRIKEEDAHVINPIHVIKGKKLRMCLDTRYTNLFTPYMRFSNETVEEIARNFLQEGDLMFTVDLEKAYYCIPLHEDYQKYFCLRHLGMIIKPRVLVFGFSGAPYYFNKIIREQIKFIRKIRMRAAAYFDDLIWFLRKEEKKETCEASKKLIDALGWIANEKSIWDAKEVIPYLGIVIDSLEMRLKPTAAKKEEVMTLVKRILKGVKEGRYDFGDLTALLGKLSWMGLVMPGTDIWTKNLDKEKNDHVIIGGWSDRTVLPLNSKEMEEELKFWVENLEELAKKGKPAIKKFKIPEISINTDASDEGWGAVIVTSGSRIEMKAGELEKTEKDSSTIREIMALEAVLKENTTRLEKKTVRVYMDSQAAETIMSRQRTHKREINTRLKRIWTECRKNEIDLDVKWIPRELNKGADLLSRVFTETRSRTKSELEEWMEQVLKKERTSTEIPVIKTAEPNYASMAIDITTENRRNTILVIPLWPSQIWWPNLFHLRQIKRWKRVEERTDQHIARLALWFEF